MKKSEAEPAIRSLSHTWYSTISAGEKEHPSFGSFRNWLQEHGHGGYLTFRSTMGANYDAEAWFDEELKQTWRR